jgi:hypothetical protein
MSRYARNNDTVILKGADTRCTSVAAARPISSASPCLEPLAPRTESQEVLDTPNISKALAKIDDIADITRFERYMYLYVDVDMQTMGPPPSHVGAASRRTSSSEIGSYDE